MTIEIKKLFNYWYEESEYSWDIAKTLFAKRKYSEALFFGHLTLEKILKALVVAKTKKHAPLVHNLVTLAVHTELIFSKAQLNELESFNSFYLAGRYDQEKMNFRKKCTPAFTNANFEKIKKNYLWLKKETIKKYRL